jgi:hypothetical protein
MGAHCEKELAVQKAEGGFEFAQLSPMRGVDFRLAEIQHE